ncbi:hypothetical protein QAD02_021849 [Eretmocerus hayati]|uniref:Uncharacterized protein n=1 Tax=Eretmocerus hayati TaxID=131215 RepID=A0ACC2PSX7_9HYME|nr:hypothetical protein QAD02_021849 [Eretmocerus hayati]
MLSMEERQNSIRHSIELDHCYTNPSPQFHSETDLQSYFDALSVEKSTFPDVENLGIVSFSGQPELNEENRGAEVERENLEKSCPKIVRQFRKDNPGQKNVTASQSSPGPPGKFNSRSTHTSHNYDNTHQKDSEIQSTDNLFLSSESSGSQSSDSDSDFGPRSCRKQAKTRLGRRTLNARVACSSKYRRRGPNKQSENEQFHLIPPEIVPSGTCEKKRGHRRQLNSLAPKHRDEQCDLTILTRDPSQKRNGIGFCNESEMSGSGEKHNNAVRDHSRRMQSLTQDQRKFESNDSIDIPSEDCPTAPGIGDDLQQDSRTSNATDPQVADEFDQIRYNAPVAGNLPISHEIPPWSSQKDLGSSQTTRNLFLKHANFDRINRPPPITEVSDQNKSTRNVKDIRVTEAQIGYRKKYSDPMPSDWLHPLRPQRVKR